MSENKVNSRAWRENKEAEKKEVMKKMSESAKDAVQSPARFKNYLKLQGIFDRYSVSNVLLINSQKPGATKIKEYDAWAEEGRRILKGEKGISILQPETYTKADGTTATSYNVKKVFDVSQVTGLEKASGPMAASRVIDALIHTVPYEIQEVNSLNFDNNGVYYNDNQGCLFIVSSEKNSSQFCQFLSLEISYAQVVSEYNNMDLDAADFMAKCVACCVCSKFGQDIGSFEFDDIPDNWRQMEPKEIRIQLDMIRTSANRIIARASQELYHKHQKDCPTK